MVGNFGKGGKKLKFRVVDELRHHHSVKDLCKFLGVSRSGYYRYLSRKNKTDKDQALKERIHYIYGLRNKRYGYRRIQAELMRLYGLRVNHKKVLRIMQKLGIQSIIRRRRFDQNRYRRQSVEPPVLR
ncbi:IS3 family transposase [Thermoactinomyces mirandus]|uniref:Transposase n=1 Tax=Thermoactinomyces mirandus TaxID=2756294 RepID=A0A7W2ASR8_9BACL|nr:IS3 family transposase [Thermoactinomyces mirandus]MBA4603908.1 transposase [Thermoactinomyces mirandus]